MNSCPMCHRNAWHLIEDTKDIRCEDEFVCRTITTRKQVCEGCGLVLLYELGPEVQGEPDDYRGL